MLELILYIFGIVMYIFTSAFCFQDGNINEKTFARLIFLSPLWLLHVIYLIIKYSYKLIVYLWKTADFKEFFYKKEEK